MLSKAPSDADCEDAACDLAMTELSKDDDHCRSGAQDVTQNTQLRNAQHHPEQISQTQVYTRALYAGSFSVVWLP